MVCGYEFEWIVMKQTKECDGQYRIFSESRCYSLYPKWSHEDS